MVSQFCEISFPALKFYYLLKKLSCLPKNLLNTVVESLFLPQESLFPLAAGDSDFKLFDFVLKSYTGMKKRCFSKYIHEYEGYRHDYKEYPHDYNEYPHDYNKYPHDYKEYPHEYKDWSNEYREWTNDYRAWKK